MTVCVEPVKTRLSNQQDDADNDDDDEEEDNEDNDDDYNDMWPGTLGVC